MTRTLKISGAVNSSNVTAVVIPRGNEGCDVSDLLNRRPVEVAAVMLAMAVLFSSGAQAQNTPSFTTGPAKTTNPGLFTCRGSRARVSTVGTIRSDDGRRWIVPADTHFQTAPKAADLYNQCSGVRLRRISDLNLKNVPVIDAGGRESFTAYIFADNYFELYVNGKLVGVDAVPFTPFNSSVVRFRAKRPFMMAVMGVDWEEYLGLGSELNRGVAYHPGDAGFVAVIKDDKGRTVAFTDKSWRAQTFYTAPLNNRSCLKLNGSVRDSSACSTASVRDGRAFTAAHWPIAENWFAPEFDDSDWPAATVFSNDTVGVENKPAFMNFRDVFDDPAADAQFSWSSNLVLDNVVLMRRTVE